MEREKNSNGIFNELTGIEPVVVYDGDLPETMMSSDEVISTGINMTDMNEACKDDSNEARDSAGEETKMSGHNHDDSGDDDVKLASQEGHEASDDKGCEDDNGGEDINGEAAIAFTHGAPEQASASASAGQSIEPSADLSPEPEPLTLVAEELNPRSGEVVKKEVRHIGNDDVSTSIQTEKTRDSTVHHEVERKTTDLRRDYALPPVISADVSLTIAEIAKQTGISASEVNRIVQNFKLPRELEGGVIKYDFAEFTHAWHQHAETNEHRSAAYTADVLKRLIPDLAHEVKTSVNTAISLRDSLNERITKSVDDLVGASQAVGQAVMLLNKLIAQVDLARMSGIFSSSMARADDLEVTQNVVSAIRQETPSTRRTVTAKIAASQPIQTPEVLVEKESAPVAEMREPTREYKKAKSKIDNGDLKPPKVNSARVSAQPPPEEFQETKPEQKADELFAEALAARLQTTGKKKSLIRQLRKMLVGRSSDESLAIFNREAESIELLIKDPPTSLDAALVDKLQSIMSFWPDLSLDSPSYESVYDCYSAVESWVFDRIAGGTPAIAVWLSLLVKNPASLLPFTEFALIAEPALNAINIKD